MRRSLGGLVLLGLLTPHPGGAQDPAAAVDQGSALLPVDTKVTHGRLSNGLTYYIRANQRPEDRAELRLVVNAGSVLEDDDQLGLAHFVEHMAFNGTERFPKQELIHYLERIGMRFGAHLNAYTSFDETVYQLRVPTDTAEVLERAFDILEDWAHRLTFDPVEVEKERGVVLEEWRLGRGAQARLRDKQFPIIFRESRYAERLPIGTPEIIQAADSATLARYYRRWYRPELMAVVAVGDFDPARIEQLVRDRFGDLRGPEGASPRVVYRVPDNRETLFAVATDPEETSSSVALYFKQPAGQVRTVEEFRRSLVERLFTNMLNARFFEIEQRPDAPFLFANTGRGGFVRPVDVFMLAASVKTGGIGRALDALLTEAERVARHGFTASELGRQKIRLLRNLEQSYDERDKTPSRQYATQYVYHYLEGFPIPGIEGEYELAQRLVPGIELAEVDGLVSEWLTDDNRVVVISAPDTERESIPAESDLLALFDAVGQKPVEPYVDSAPMTSLLAERPAPGTITSEQTIDTVGVIEWTLENGVRVILKPTDFEDDEIVFEARSPGGHSLVPDEDYVSAITAAQLAYYSGVGDLSLVDLQKVKTGKAASVFPDIYDVGEGFSGSASPKDLETLFQLVYLYFTEPRLDSVAFATFQEQMREFLRNRDADPEVAFQDTITVLLSQNHFRMRPFTAELFAEMDLDRSRAFFRDRFADASDFTFVFVGSFTVDSIRPLVRRYLATLPALHRDETWRDVGIRPPDGIHRREVRRGLEPQSQTRLYFHGPFEFTGNRRYLIGALGEVLQLRLRETLREDLGGTYGAGVYASARRIPRAEYTIAVSFGSAPDRADELTAAVFAQIDSLQRHGPRPDEVDKIREMHRRGRQTSLRENRFWLGQLSQRAQFDLPYERIYAYDDLVAALTPEAIRMAAREWIRTDNYIQVTLLPENTGPVPEPDRH